MGDSEDPELYAAWPLHQFMQTEKGLWIRANCNDPQYVIRSNANLFGQKIIVYGEVEDRLATEYYLRWDYVQA